MSDLMDVSQPVSSIETPISRVLIVEDHADSRALIEAMVRMSFAAVRDVVEFEEPDVEAIKAAVAPDPAASLVVCDGSLTPGGFEGPEIALAVRENFPNARVVLQSNQIDDPDKEEILARLGELGIACLPKSGGFAPLRNWLQRLRKAA